MNICLCCGDKGIYKDILINLAFFWIQLWEENYTLVDAQIHGEYNEQRINFVRLCIQKVTIATLFC